MRGNSLMTSSRKPSRPMTKGVAPFAGATDVDAIQRRAPANLSGIENLAHRRLPSSGRPIRLGGAVVFLQCCDGGFELGRDLGALATGQAAAQFGAEFVDVVLKRDHRPLLLFRRRDGRTAPIGPGQGRLRREAGAGEPILLRAEKKRALLRAPYARQNRGHCDPWAGPIGAVRWEV